MSATLAAASSPARFLSGRYACADGEHGYLLYVPASLNDQALQGLIVMLHGALQDPEGFALGVGMNDLAEAHGLLVAYPATICCEAGTGSGPAISSAAPASPRSSLA